MESNIREPQPQAWTEVSKGHWQRPLALMERILAGLGNHSVALAGGREDYMVNSCIKIKCQDEPDVKDLRQAWIHARFTSPKLAAFLAADCATMHYSVPDEAALTQWSNDTFLVVQNSSFDEVYSEWTPSRVATMTWLPKTHELVYRCPHWNTDAIGQWLLWNIYLTSLGQIIESKGAPVPLIWGEEVENLPQSVAEAFSVMEHSAADMEAAQALMASAFLIQSKVGPAPLLKTVAQSKQIEFVYNEEQTAVIISASKRLGVSITSLFHAALGMANVEATPKAQDGITPSTYVTFGQFNLRKFLDPTAPELSHQVVNSFFGTIPAVVQAENFLELAKSLNVFYKETFKGQDDILRSAAFWDFVSPIMTSKEGLAAPQQGDATLSSVGIADDYIKKSYGSAVEVVDLHQCIEIFFGFFVVTLYTFGGKLRFTYCYNEGTQDKSIGERIIQLMRGIVDQAVASK